MRLLPRLSDAPSLESLQYTHHKAYVSASVKAFDRLQDQNYIVYPMRRLFRSTSLLALLLASFACNRSATSESNQLNESNESNESAEAGVEAHDHDEDDESPVAAAAAEERLSSERSVGEAVSDDVQLVSAQDIVADPERFSGQTVRIQGTVKGYCHHRRGWFAIDVPSGRTPYLRFITAPRFEVPPGIMNASVTAVGTVEIIEVPGSRVSHYEREHALGAGEAATGRARRATIRATGAVFSPAEQ